MKIKNIVVVLLLCLLQGFTACAPPEVDTTRPYNKKPVENTNKPPFFDVFIQDGLLEPDDEFSWDMDTHTFLAEIYTSDLMKWGLLDTILTKMSVYSWYAFIINFPQLIRTL